MPKRVIGLDKLGVVIALIVLAGWFALPFVDFKPNRILPGEPRSIFAALPPLHAAILAAMLAVSIPVSALRTPTIFRLAMSFVALAAIAIYVGIAGHFLTPDGDKLVRIAPGAGFWVLTGAFALLAADSLTRLRLGPWPRIAILAVVAIGLGALLWSGSWSDLSILKEYASRADAFWREGQTHVLLAFGSLVVATAVGIPLGVACYRNRRLRNVVLNVLNAVQTIPSIALFGLLIAPLGALAAAVPALAAIGVSGIGAAPAMVALFIYSLLPVVSNTVVGLVGVPEAANDAARGMGMTDRQRLFSVELPLAFPVILTGIRIVLVQNIGLATIAALIGGGGFGVFVFQGIGQTAMDLVLLGAVPTVALAFASAVILDAIVEMVSPREPAND
ncbi:ABC transporter permease [Devosia sp. 17-2-E-8]|nr:ABC transporter permease [Devosia sp. 17-2-E-8]